MCFRIQAFCFVMTKMIFYVEKHELYVTYSRTVVCCLGMLVFGLTLTLIRLLYNDGASRTKTERVIVMSICLCKLR